jgi:PhnB protein
MASGPVRSITPRMFVADVDGAVGFLRDVFGATGEVQHGRPTDVVVGDSVIMVSGVEERDPFPVFLHVSVEDADATFDRALAAGAQSIEDPADMPFGLRRAMVRDPFGNVFQIGHPLPM